MRTGSPPLIVALLGWVVIIAIPVAFFVFGWKDIEIQCHRPAARALPVCSIEESFGMGLHTRRVSASNVTQIGYRTGTAMQPSQKAFMAVHPSTLVFETTSGEVPIGNVVSAVDHSIERDLILKARAFLNAPETLTFRHEAGIHGLFGYVGLAGVVALLSILAAVAWHHVRRALAD